MNNPNCTAKPDVRIALTLIAIATKYKRQWCYPAQNTLLKLLSKWHRIDMTRRTLNRHLAGLEARGYIKRIRRHTKDTKGSLILKSTVYAIQGASWALLGGIKNLLGNLSTEIVDRFNTHAVPLTAQKARLESIIINHQHKKVRKRTFW